VSDKPQKCFFDLRGYAVGRYRLPSDGRKRLKQCQGRRSLAIELAGYANPDGSNITVGVKELARVLGMAESTVRVYLKDLETLGLLINEEQRQKQPRKRRINVRVFQTSGIEEQASGIEDLGLRDSDAIPPGLEPQTSGIQIQASGIGVHTSGIGTSGIRLKAVETCASTENQIPTALPTPTPTHNRLTEEEAEACVVCVLEHPTTGEYSWTTKMTGKQRSQMKELATRHGRTKFLAAYEYFLNHNSLDARTDYPFSFFIATFEGLLAELKNVVNEKDRQRQQECDREITDRFHRIRQPLSQVPSAVRDEKNDEIRDRNARWWNSLTDEERNYITAVTSADGLGDFPKDASPEKSKAIFDKWYSSLKQATKEETGVEDLFGTETTSQEQE
jgi:hypothetical protein